MLTDSLMIADRLGWVDPGDVGSLDRTEFHVEEQRRRRIKHLAGASSEFTLRRSDPLVLDASNRPKHGHARPTSEIVEEPGVEADGAKVALDVVQPDQ